jgi:branched-chain amino acid transport system permease protein
VSLGDILLQQLINGLILGSFYSLVALGYSMVYGIIKLLNFAHGDIYMVGAFISLGSLIPAGRGAWAPAGAAS